MKPVSLFLFSLLLCSFASFAQAPGYPSRDKNLDVLPGFRNPPAGYGEVPFWWWSGDPLDKERLLWQIEELHKKGVTGMQVNYMHKDTPGWPTYPAEPELFTDAWWEMWKFAADECGKRGMGIGLSGYTLDWPKGDNLFNRLIYNDPEINGREIRRDTVLAVQPQTEVTLPVSAEAIGVWAYLVSGGALQSGGRDLSGFVKDGRLVWNSGEKTWQIWVFSAPRISGTLNPIHPLAGKTVIDKFFQPFQDHAVNQSSEGLNYFFQDELQFGVGDVIWSDDFREEFRKRKDYDVFEVLPAMFTDLDTVTPKARLDFMDVKVSLSEERYFIPIFDWHHSRGLIYGCDPEGRGYNPGQYGDNFRTQRWYTSPGHDTPGGHADLIKGKVSSSIAAFYNRPRVWLEGYHSLGWGATPERLMYATSENYLYGCNLLNLHGLYYTTHGSFWEWAPPCYHFRMPYWDHMSVFLKYFERLSYLMSQGVLQSDIAIIYPVSPAQARMDGQAATDAAFTAGRELFKNGYDFVFIDDQSIERSVIRSGKMEVSDMSFKVLIIPSMKAIHWSVLQKALEFQRSGGIVINIGALPEASDRAGSGDPVLDQAVKELFGTSGFKANDPMEAVALIKRLVPRDVQSHPQVRSTHRRIGSRDVYLVMDAKKDSWCTFRATGTPELWDPWTGSTRPVMHVAEEGGVRVRMPLDSAQAQVIVFSAEGLSRQAGRVNRNPVTGHASRVSDSLPRVTFHASRVTGLWEFHLLPTMNNRFGDFRLPVTEQMIGAEARIFRYSEETTGPKGWEQPDFNDSLWPRVTYGFGQKFWKLGPLPEGTDVSRFEKAFAEAGRIEPRKPVIINGVAYRWTPYDFSWRWGREGDPGHQGWHGLKEDVTDEFICLGKPTEGHNEILYEKEAGGTRYYLWTSAAAGQDCEAAVDAGGLVPAGMILNGSRVDPATKNIRLKKGNNSILLRYDSPGRGHFVLIQKGLAEAAERTPLSMKWWDQPGRIPLDVRANEMVPAGWYRFTAPPGLKGMTIRANGTIQVWVDGVNRKVGLIGSRTPNHYQVKLDKPVGPKCVVAIRIEQNRGDYGGAALPEPILLECGKGVAEAGDWAVGSVMENYSGGVWYRKTLDLRLKKKEERLKKEEKDYKIMLDLGEVVATAEVRINGKVAGILVCPPWQVDISDYVKNGKNRIEILVFNTLSNHYLTVPSRYKGNSLKSGLIGPVRIWTTDDR